MSLPGAGETVPTTILEELNRSLVNSASSLQQIQQEATKEKEEQQQQQQQKEPQLHPSQTLSSSLSDIVHSKQIKISDDDDDHISIDDDDDLSADENVGDDETILNENETAIVKKSDCGDKGGDIESVNRGSSGVDSVNDTRKLLNLNNNHLPQYQNSKQNIYDIEEVLNFELQTVANVSQPEQLGQSEELNFNSQTSSTVDNKSFIAPVLLKPDGVKQFTIDRDRSISPPPLPLVTYRWEDCRRSKEKVCFIKICFLFFKLMYTNIYFVIGWISVDVS